LRGVVPFAVVLALFVGSGVTWWVDHFSPSDPAFLSPESQERAGSKTLAQRLADRGVSVHRYTNSRDALRAADGGDATLFVPAPEYVWPAYLEAFSQLETTVVLVMPGQSTLGTIGLPVVADGQRFATGLASPGCDHPVASQAGSATVLRQRYAAVKPAEGQSPVAYRCYGGSLVTGSLGDTRFELVGAADPFTNDRIGEAGNAALAVGLLAERSRVAWLDLHGPESPPQLAPGGDHPWDQPTGDGSGSRDGTGNGSGSGNGSGTGDGSGSGDGRGDGSGSGSDSGSSGSSDPGNAQSDEPNPLATAFPPWLWAIVVQLLLAALLYALWRGRRLGSPISEPLPVVVRSAETVEGRARLYQRAKARGAAVSALRTGALRRLAPALDVRPDASEDTVVAVVAARSGWPADHVREVLYGPEPDDDARLAWRAEALDALVRAVGNSSAGANGRQKGQFR
jgi:hypothetical protein